MRDAGVLAATTRMRAASARLAAPRGPWRLALARLRRDRSATAALAVLALLVAFAAAAPLLERWTGHAAGRGYPATGLDPSGRPVPPSGEFWLGADALGRDVLVRAAYGARVSLLVGVAATALATLLGTAAGTAAGLLGGAADALLGRLADIVLSFPYLLVAIVVATTFGGGLATTVCVIAVFSAAGMARVVRGQVLAIREQEYVQAARALGAGPLWIMAVEVAPNLAAPVTALAALQVPQAIVLESTLTFLGAGADPATPSWGGMLAEAQDYYQTAWWFLLVPAGLLLAATIAFTVLGDAVHAAVSPRRT
ncbi:peptide ABC transporter permease [Actinomadura sp. NBRC 104425]|nr:peptide ABC transporter permease [Actinomadura sp. NBRC 104425]